RPGGVLNALASARTESTPPTPSTHRLRRGLPGYLIVFAPHAFTSQRQYRPREPLSPRVFFLISAHFTATPGIPLSSSGLQPDGFHRQLEVKPPVFTTDLSGRLHALYAQ